MIGKKNKNNEGLIKISDLFLVAALVSKGHKFVKAVKEGEYIHFLFQEKPEIREIMKQYYNNELFVNAKRFATEYKTLKQMKFNL